MSTFIVSMAQEIISEERANNDVSNSFESSFRQYYEALVKYATSMVKETTLAEDLVQAVFEDYWKDRNKVIIHTSIKAYLYKGVYFKCMNFLKRRKIENKFIAQAHTEEAYDDDQLASKELQIKINHAIEALPQECQKIFTMSRYDHLKYHEIATALHLSPKTIENQMGKALRLLRQALTEYLVLLFTILTILPS